MLGGHKFAKKKHSYTQALQASQMDYFNALPLGIPSQSLGKTCQKLYRAQSYLHQEVLMPTHFAFQNASLVFLILLEKN
jgi:hypothetical protein